MFYVADVEVFGTVYRNESLYLTDERKDYILLGRNVLNQHYLNLEGPQHRYFVDP